MSDDPAAGLQLLPAPGELPQLKDRYNRASDALLKLRLEAAAYERQALDEARERITREVQQRYGEQQRALAVEIAAAEQALEDEKDRLARAGIASAPRFANSPAPPVVGTVMVEDEEAISRQRRGPRRAVVEIVSRAMLADASSRLRSVGLGDFVLHVLDRDGSLSDEYAPLDRYRWRPES